MKKLRSVLDKASLPTRAFFAKFSHESFSPDEVSTSLCALSFPIDAMSVYLAVVGYNSYIKGWFLSVSGYVVDLDEMPRHAL